MAKAGTKAGMGQWMAALAIQPVILAPLLTKPSTNPCPAQATGNADRTQEQSLHPEVSTAIRIHALEGVLPVRQVPQSLARRVWRLTTIGIWGSNLCVWVIRPTRRGFTCCATAALATSLRFGYSWVSTVWRVQFHQLVQVDRLPYPWVESNRLATSIHQ